MGNINGWQDNFTKRCEAVGWIVKRTQSNHFKVTDAKGNFLFTFPSSPGDVRAMKNTLADAKRLGLLDLEARAKLVAERERLERIERDRASVPQFIEPVVAVKPDSATSDSTAMETAEYGDVDGVKIVAIAPAMFKTPVMPQAVPLVGGQEIMLSDGRVLFRCLNDAQSSLSGGRLDGTCHRVFDRVKSLHVHVGFHARKRAAAAAAELEREDNVAKSTAVIAPKRNVVESTSIDPDLTSIDDGLVRLQRAIQDLADQASPLIVDIENLRNEISKLPLLDDATREKIQVFESLRNVFK